MDSAFNITMSGLHYAAKAYDIASRTLQQHNVTLPSPQIIVYSFQAAAQQLGNAATSFGLPTVRGLPRPDVSQQRWRFR
ncbi:hypothetical protein INT44_002266 [Umbelopsis vinacea]|uniref:Uncharacterized protein n=1 Tax=Umbelopsis vinacea TaxID=44442 RepID=A0A8H7Q546_9FUNG|nr:hypothetical protein INT44_002266 [Umbelopsis vinacea]